MSGNGSHPETSLLRTAGLPMRLWCAAGSPELFGLIRDHERLEDEYRRQAGRLADAIGAKLVPAPGLCVRDRRLALAARRRLHRGLQLPGAEHERLVAMAADVAHSSLLCADLVRVAALGKAVAEVGKAVVRQHDEAQQRLAETSYETLHDSPIGRRALLDGSLPVGAELIERRAAGAPWTDKQVRKRADYLWRMIARGAAKVTPRGWLGHVALVQVAGGAGQALALTGEVSTHWTQNFAEGHRAGEDGVPDPATWVSFAPLLRAEPGHLLVFALEAVEGIVLTPVRIRRTTMVESLYRTLRDGARQLSDVEKAILPASAGEAHREVLHRFLVMLSGMGILHLRLPSPQYRHGWRPPSAEPGDARRIDGGYLDVYRRATGTISATGLAELREAIGHVLRLQALITEDAGPAHAGRYDFLDDQDRPVLDVMRDRMAARADKPESGAAHGRRAGWPAARTPGSGYACMLDWLGMLAASASYNGKAIDITPQLLDRFGAPHSQPQWPLDSIVRPLPDQRWALDLTAPAGVLDARFISALERLHGPLPHVSSYRRFLRRLDAESAVRSVELLFPALSRYAANAVRRPLYTDWWTGDPDLDAYCAGDLSRPQFLALDELTARRADDRVVISFRGAPIRPLYHSARNAPPPWDLISALLLAGSPQPSAWQRRLRHTLTALPGQTFVPRVTVGGTLVLSAAQWRVPADLLPQADASELDNVRRVARLRAQLGLPRWVFVSAGAGVAAPMACDLDSLRAVNVLQRMAARAVAPGEVVVEEMVPSPPELTVPDLADPAGARVAAELMVRVLPPG